MIPEYRTAFLRKALGDRYEFEGFLGKGAFASVFLVKNRRLERYEALKVLAESYDGDHQFAHRFVDEAKLIASLSHPNIVQVHDYGDVDGVLWYAMQYVDGPSLRKELTARQRMAADDVVRLTLPLLGALAYSHRRDIIHRDIKPGNVLIDASGRPFLMDFGIAKVKGSSLKTQTGSVMGTPTYIAPEQASGDSLDSRCDIYSLGTTLYELLAGYAPFTSSDPLRTLLRRLKEDPVPLREAYTEIDPELDRIVLKSLARDPADRYQTADEMAADLRRLYPSGLENQGIEVRAAADSYTALPEIPSVEPEDPSEVKTVITSAVKVSPAPGSPTRLDIDPDQPTVSVDVATGAVQPAPPPSEADTAAVPERAPAQGRAWLGAALAALLVLAAGLWWIAAGRDSAESATETPAAEVPAVEAPAVEPSDASPADPSSADPSSADSSPSADLTSSDDSSPSGDLASLEAPTTAAGDAEVDPEPVSQGAPERSEIDGAESSSKSEGPVSEPPQAAGDRAPTRSAARDTASKTEPPPPAPAPPPPIFRRPVEMPRLETKVDPVMSPDNARLCVGQQVFLDLVIDASGRVKSSKVLQSERPECAAAARAAVAEYRFTPALDYERKPIEARTSLYVDFENLKLETEDP